MKLIEVECEYCGTLFEYLYHGGHRRKYCSHLCLGRAYRLRVEERKVSNGRNVERV